MYRSTMRFVVLLAMLVSPAMPAMGDDAQPSEKPKVVKPTIEFPPFPPNLDQQSKYSFSIVVEVAGSDQKLKVDFRTIACFDPEGLAFTIKAGIEPEGITCSQAKGVSAVEVDGWTDPKTKKFHPVKSIKFETKDLPKKYWPTIKMPPNL